MKKLRLSLMLCALAMGIGISTAAVARPCCSACDVAPNICKNGCSWYC
ncbi:MAG: hypothetical protein LKM32_00015 [Chiayiivirga sp.]|nr:hypothetical protein [Chiayiivirga sp.]MCI1727821.1 hypothetical protein [Chiayiivirga sp.]